LKIPGSLSETSGDPDQWGGATGIFNPLTLMDIESKDAFNASFFISKTFLSRKRRYPPSNPANQVEEYWKKADNYLLHYEKNT